MVGWVSDLEREGCAAKQVVATSCLRVHVFARQGQDAREKKNDLRSLLPTGWVREMEGYKQKHVVTIHSN